MRTESYKEKDDWSSHQVNPLWMQMKQFEIHWQTLKKICQDPFFSLNQEMLILLEMSVTFKQSRYKKLLRFTWGICQAPGTFNLEATKTCNNILKSFVFP